MLRGESDLPWVGSDYNLRSERSPGVDPHAGTHISASVFFGVRSTSRLTVPLACVAAFNVRRRRNLMPDTWLARGRRESSEVNLAAAAWSFREKDNPISGDSNTFSLRVVRHGRSTAACLPPPSSSLNRSAVISTDRIQENGRGRVPRWTC